MHLVNGVPTTTSITAAGLTVEASPPASARVDIVGLQGATGDIEIDFTGGVITITSTALDFTTFSLVAGQFIHVAGTATANRFFAAPNTDNSGYVRIVSVAANAIIVDKATETFVTDIGAAADIQIFFGRFIKNVACEEYSSLKE